MKVRFVYMKECTDASLTGAWLKASGELWSVKTSVTDSHDAYT